jgi:hypothetical protein
MEGTLLEGVAMLTLIDTDVGVDGTVESGKGTIGGGV